MDKKDDVRNCVVTSAQLDLSFYQTMSVAQSGDGTPQKQSQSPCQVLELHMQEPFMMTQSQCMQKGSQAMQQYLCHDHVHYTTQGPVSHLHHHIAM